MISIKLDGIEKAKQMIDPAIVRQAARAAITRATSSGKTIISKEITDVWNVKKADVDNRIKVYPPRSDDMKGTIYVGGSGMSLSYFGAKQIMNSAIRSRSGKTIKTTKMSKKMKKAGPVPQGVMVQILKGKDTILLRNAFMASVTAGKSGSHIGVFYRLGKKRFPIGEKSVVSIATMVNKPEVMDRVIARITERWDVEFPRQLAYFVSKAGQ